MTESEILESNSGNDNGVEQIYRLEGSKAVNVHRGIDAKTQELETTQELDMMCARESETEIVQ
jgi:hypothetical protein